MATSKTEICNMALALINEPEIQTIENPTTKTEKILARFYNEVFEEVCASHAWNFCTRVALLALNEEKPYNFAFKYVVPVVPKTLRVLELATDYIDPRWERQGDFILSDIENLSAKLIFLEERVSRIPAHVVRCISTLLASRIAIPMLGIEGGKLAEYYQGMFDNNVAPNALMLDAQEGHELRIEESSLLDAVVIEGNITAGSSILNETFEGI